MLNKNNIVITCEGEDSLSLKLFKTDRDYLRGVWPKIFIFGTYNLLYMLWSIRHTSDIFEVASKYKIFFIVFLITQKEDVFKKL